MAFLELFDDTDEPLVARSGSLVYDYDYQIEMYVDEIIAEYRGLAPGLIAVKMYDGDRPDRRTKTHDRPLIAEWTIVNGLRGERTKSPRPHMVMVIPISSIA